MVKNRTSIYGFVSGALAYICQYANISQETVILVMILISIDTATGVLSSIKRNKKITSRGLRWGTLGKALMLCIPFIIALLGKIVGIDLSVVSTILWSWIGTYEAYSIIGNIKEIYQRESVNEQDALTQMLDAVLKLLKNQLKKIDEKRDEN